MFSKHGWSLWQEITISSKFRGKYLSIMPLGELGPVLFEGRKTSNRGRVCQPRSQAGPLWVTLAGFLHEYRFWFLGPWDWGQAGWP